MATTMKTRLFDKIILIITISCLIALSGCSFTSQSRSKSPYFDGVIKFNDNAVENVKVMLSTEPDDTLCLKAKKFTSTDEQGKFSFKAIIEDYTYKPFINYQLDEWTVCATYNEHTYTLYSNNRYAPGNVTGSIYLDCDLATRPVNKPCIVNQ